MSKKKVFGITLFIILGLVMFTFANPNENEEDNKKLEENNQAEQQPTEEQPTTDVNNEVEEDNQTNIIPTTTTPNNKQNNNVNNTENEDETTNEQETPVDDENTNNENENLDEYKQNKKVEINEYLASLELKDESNAKTLIEEANQKIDNATTKEEIDEVVDEAKKTLDELKAKEELEKAKKELEVLKEEKIQEIKDYKNEYIYNDENQEKYDDLLDSIIENIKNSETKEEVTESLDEGTDAIDALIEEDLEVYKELKIKEIVEYKEAINWNESYEVLASIIVDNAKDLINQSTTKEEIDKIVNEVFKTLDNLKNNQSIDEYKEAKKQEVEEYNNNELYSEENQKLVDEIKKDSQELIANATTLEEIDQIVTESKEQIDEIQKLTETKFTVIFKDFYNNVVKTEEVLYGESAKAPTVKNTTNKSIVYSFEKWDKEFTNIKSELTVKAIYKVEKIYANIYALNEGLAEPTDNIKYGTNDYSKIGSIELNITDELLNVISENKTINIATDEETIRNMVIGTLPELDKQNYKYNYYVLKFEKADGFHIDASQVIDEEELAKNTVTITYQFDDSLAGCVMENNQTTITSTVTTGKNEITALPKVYKDGKEYAVVWKDSNDKVVSTITENNINLIENPTVYTESTTLTATIDKEAPVLTLTGDKNIEVELSLTDEYVELGYSAVDNFEGNISTNVTTKITYNGIDTNEVNYSVEGVYVITYSIQDKEGNKATTTRTITVIDPIKEITANIYLLKENVERPETDFDKDNYTKIGEVNLKINRVRKYINGPSQIITTKNNIQSYVEGGPKALPTTNEKYYYYEYYSLRYDDGKFYIEVEKIFDSESYKKDKKVELNELLNKDYSEYESTKTSESYNNLINTVNNNKNKELNSIEEIENAIKEINNAINNLENIKLLKLTLSRNNDTYLLNEKMNMDVIITAVYNDSTRNKVLMQDEYQVSEDFDSKTVGKKSITYTYENKSVTYNYTVNYSNKELNKKVEKVKITLVHEVVRNEGEYWYDDTFEDKYSIKFENLSGLEVTSIQIENNGKIVRNIELKKETDNTFVITAEDYEYLKSNNTLFYGNTIKISYSINEQKTTENYYELMNELYIVK